MTLNTNKINHTTTKLQTQTNEISFDKIAKERILEDKTHSCILTVKGNQTNQRGEKPL
jgi:hypothetical protein